MDAVPAIAVAALLLTALACAGCGGARRSPAHTPVPPAPPAPARIATLRVGLPAPRRANLLFTCGAPPGAAGIGSAVYAPDSLDAGGHRWLRLQQAATDSIGALAPDTLLLRAFEDATDEEIAFERGELDAAVFWPGELSARMRSDARFRDPELGLRRVGVLACVAGAGDTSGVPRADMELLNREAFGGDLLPWSELEPGAGAVSDPETAPGAAAARYVVDATVPGARQIERILARVPRSGATRMLKLVYLDQPVAAGGVPVQGTSPAAAWRTPGVTPVFALRCPVLVGSRARDGVRAIGAGAFAELAPCAGGTRR